MQSINSSCTSVLKETTFIQDPMSIKFKKKYNTIERASSNKSKDKLNNKNQVQAKIQKLSSKQ